MIVRLRLLIADSLASGRFRVIGRSRPVDIPTSVESTCRPAHACAMMAREHRTQRTYRRGGDRGRRPNADSVTIAEAVVEGHPSGDRGAAGSRGGRARVPDRGRCRQPRPHVCRGVAARAGPAAGRGAADPRGRAAGREGQRLPVRGLAPARGGLCPARGAARRARAALGHRWAGRCRGPAPDARGGRELRGPAGRRLGRRRLRQPCRRRRRRRRSRLRGCRARARRGLGGGAAPEPGRARGLPRRPGRAGHGAQGADSRPHRPGRPRGPRDARPRPRFAPRERPVSLSVLTAVSHRWESELVTALEASASLTVVRRCADLADLLAAASAGLADVAILSADLRSLDRAALHHLASHSVRVAGAGGPGDDPGERRLRELGIDVVVHSGAATHELEEALEQLDTLTGPATLPFGEAAAPHGASAPGASGDGEGWVPVEDSQLIAVWGPTGAPGRTTVALNLAAELAHRGARTLLVDADTYGSSIAQSLALLDEAPGVAAAARAADQGSLDLHSLARLAPEVTARLRVLTGIPRADRWPELR